MSISLELFGLENYANSYFPTKTAIENRNQDQHLYAIILQWLEAEKDPLRILEWVFAPFQPKKTITTRLEMFSLLIIKERSHVIEIAGEEPGKL